MMVQNLLAEIMNILHLMESAKNVHHIQQCLKIRESVLNQVVKMINTLHLTESAGIAPYTMNNPQIRKNAMKLYLYVKVIASSMVGVFAKSVMFINKQLAIRNLASATHAKNIQFIRRMVLAKTVILIQLQMNKSSIV